ncbi:hypothetical protein C8Q73DRAFT_66949 [Cubamyces lactineus]|nr:hypothetical protein C8Q73DRAFT_66949 [Cubamyces lactineus]
MVSDSRLLNHGPHPRSNMTSPVVSQLFNRADADIVFRSSDNVEFRLHKLILGMASPIFNDMFSLPQPQCAGEQPQVVDATETASVLESLLPFCYPMARPTFLRVDHLLSVLHSAEKYEMTFISTQLLRNLRNFLPTEPSRIYAIACLREDADLVRAAAKVLLGTFPLYDPHNFPPEFDRLPATALAKIEAYRKDCAAAALSTLHDFDRMPSRIPSRFVSVSRKGNVDLSSAWVWLTCESCTGGNMRMAIANAATGQRHRLTPRAWWQRYFDAVAEELGGRPLASIVTEMRFMRPAIDSAAECEECGQRAAADLMDYAEAMAKRIQGALSKVAFVLPFGQPAELKDVCQPDGLADRDEETNEDTQ